MLKGLGAPEDVSTAVIDAAAETVVAATNCTVTDVTTQSDGVAFTRLDNGLPLNLGILSGLNHRWVPIPDGINGYRLAVRGLPEGRYEIRASGRMLGSLDASKLAEGVNIASMTADGWEPGGPWDAQSDIVKELVDARDRLELGTFFRSRWLANHPDTGDLDAHTKEVEERLVDLQRATAKPYRFRFEIKRAVASEK
jgi:hypothetical protein